MLRLSWLSSVEYCLTELRPMRHSMPDDKQLDRGDHEVAVPIDHTCTHSFACRRPHNTT